MMIKFTYCANFATAETLERPWNDMVKTLTVSKPYPSKEASVKRAAFVGGVRADEDKGRANGNIIARTVATLDFDAPRGTLDDIAFALELSMPCAFVAYSTFRHTPEAPRFRLCVPLSRPVGEHEHRVIVNEIARLVDLGPVDNCSFVMSQIMFLPSHKEGVTPWSLRGEGAAWDCGEATEVEEIAGDDFGDLEAMVAAEPLDMSADEVDALLENYPSEDKEYDEWVRVGMALYHQFRGSDEGYARWVAWSAKSPKHNARQMRTKWRSFGGAARPVTMASIIKLAGGRSRAVEIQPTSSIFEGLEAEARGLMTREAYTGLRNKVSGMSEAQLHMDSRSMLAAAAHVAFGKGAGLSLSEVKKAFKPAKATGDGFVANVETPEWAQDIVYCAGENSFERVSTRHSIKPDAFRIAHAGETEVIAAELDAVTYIMRNRLIPKVDAKMYWPGFGPMFTDARTGLSLLNTYEKDGVEPCDVLDEEGRAVIARFMAHLDLTVALEAERLIILDFMAFVFQNPGRRVQWALLIKGIEGNGKTYFFRIMERLMGRQTSVVTTLAIESNFTSWAEGSVLACVEEIYIQGANKYAILNKMKPMITNNQIAVMAKNKNERTVPNFTSYMMFTNHADAIPVGDGDRRYCVIATRQTRKEELFNQLGGAAGLKAYFDQLFGDLDRRPDAFARFFCDYKLSAAFSASGRAPETEGLSDMRNMHLTEDHGDLDAALERYACDIIGADIVDTTYLLRSALMDGLTIPQTSRLNHLLSDKGLVKIEGGRVNIGKEKDKHSVWFRRGSGTDTGEPMTSDRAKAMVRAFFSKDKDFVDPAP